MTKEQKMIGGTGGGGGGGGGNDDTISNRVNKVNVDSGVKGIDLTFTNFFRYLSMITPLLLTFFMVMLSIINSNLKGFMYLLGLSILFVIIVMLQNIIKTNLFLTDNKPTSICRIFNVPIQNGFYSVPSYHSSLYGFTIIYFLIPMIVNNMMNFSLIVVLLMLYMIDVVIKLQENCTTTVGIVLGTVMGIFWGMLWYTILKVTKNEKFLYYDEYISGRVACTRPTQQKFKCAVYKNGELIKAV